jgi:hypothetical protein
VNDLSRQRFLPDLLIARSIGTATGLASTLMMTW